MCRYVAALEDDTLRILLAAGALSLVLELSLEPEGALVGSGCCHSRDSMETQDLAWKRMQACVVKGVFYSHTANRSQRLSRKQEREC